jgi:hypothetical protein
VSGFPEPDTELESWDVTVFWFCFLVCFILSTRQTTSFCKREQPGTWYVIIVFLGGFLQGGEKENE